MFGERLRVSSLLMTTANCGQTKRGWTGEERGGRGERETVFRNPCSAVLTPNPATPPHVPHSPHLPTHISPHTCSMPRLRASCACSLVWPPLSSPPVPWKPVQAHVTGNTNTLKGCRYTSTSSALEACTLKKVHIQVRIYVCVQVRMYEGL